AHDRVLDLVVCHVDPVERRKNRDRAQLGCLTAGEPTAQLAERRAPRRDDHGTGHARNLSPGEVGSGAMHLPLRTWAWSWRSERGGSPAVLPPRAQTARETARPLERLDRRSFTVP